ncbi:unnamed protein product [Sphenostylis stenocarpa]|uniref:Uncharacterized protein n=1 Tax=Sphenostylis stenocarpa TaxID=92480 RepID=A0AA86VBB3_9FABA|nr:unnamed protein product [Sphenostylis stenocarpa]
MRCAVVTVAVSKDRTSIRTVEEAVKSVIGPIYDKFHLVPDELIRIADLSVSAAQHSPSPAPPTASDIAEAALAKCKPATKEVYERFEAKAEQCGATAWRRLFPPAPKAACWTEKYNDKVLTAAKGCRVSALVPMEKIARILSEKRA